MMKSVKDLIGNNNDLYNRHKYVSKEFQDYGYRLALKLGELKSVSLYIKLAKEKPRALLEQSFSFAIDYPNAKSRGKLFMWKLKELEKEYKAKKEREKPKSKSKGNVSQKKG